MSFKVNWNSLETDSLSTWTKEILTNALNSGKSPHILASNISIKDLNFGQSAPDFEILEIGELDRDRFRGIFKISYSGDFHLTLHTKVQANPLNIYYSNSLEKEVGIEDSEFITPQFGLSNEQFAIPLDLKLSDIKISGIGIIVFSKSKGLTLVFRNDPLDSIKVSSTFDTVQVLANFLQKQIESQIRDLFRETLPTLIHQLSLKYLSLDNNMNELRTRLAANASTSSSSTSSSTTSSSSSSSPSSFTSSLDSANTTASLKMLENEEEDFSLVYSAKNLQKNLKLFKSRETMSLHIPRFRNIVQRTHLDKFTKNYPNLINSLALSNNELQKFTHHPHSHNAVPIDIFKNESFEKTDGLLKDISNIQAGNYYKFATQKENTVKPKRRVIRLGKSKNKSKSKSKTEHNDENNKNDNQIVPPSSTPVSSSNSTLIEEMVEEPSTPIMKETSEFINPATKTTPQTQIHHPTPRKLELRVQADPELHSDVSTDSHSRSSAHHALYQEFIRSTQSPSLYDKVLTTCGGVGLGNTGYFSFVPQRALSASPIKALNEELKEKKSMNHMDFNRVSQRLEEKLKQKNNGDMLRKNNSMNSNSNRVDVEDKPQLVHHDTLSATAAAYAGLFTAPPPPYYH